MDGMKHWTPVAGMPQGSVISPLLANLYLHGLDELISDAGIHYARFADDFVALCRTRQEAEAAIASAPAQAGEASRLWPDDT